MAVIPQLAKLELDKRPDPLLDFKWYSAVIPFGLPSNYLESADLPFNNIDVGENVYGAGGFTCYPSSHKISSFNATFYEDQLCTTLKWLMHPKTGWKSAVKSFKTGFYNVPSEYKRDWTITLLNTKNEPILNYKLIGVWPSNTSNFALNYTSNGRLVLTQDFSIDDAEIDFLR